jgi:hypothetical protein
MGGPGTIVSILMQLDHSASGGIETEENGALYGKQSFIPISVISVLSAKISVSKWPLVQIE